MSPDKKRFVVHGPGNQKLEFEGDFRDIEIEFGEKPPECKSTRVRVGFEDVMKDHGVPEHFNFLSEGVKGFNLDHPYDKTAFVMMKFPDQKGLRVKDKILDDIFKLLRSGLRPYGVTAVRADGKDYSSRSDLWENVSIYMLGSKYGIAVLEAKYKKELNPNVAQEYGFMLALGKQVMLLEEESFKLRRADMLGTNSQRFKWSKGSNILNKTIKQAIENWMVNLGKPRIVSL